MKNKVVTYLIFLFITVLLNAQNDEQRIQQLSVKDGLLSSNTWSLAQDSTGYIWIGMDKGIARYDGFDVLNYSSADEKQNGLTGEIITSIFIDSENQLWAGSKGRGIFKLNKSTNRFENISLTDSASDYYNSNKVSKILEDNSGNKWAITYNGIIRIDKHTNEVERFLTNENQELVYRSSFASIAKDKYGCFWFTDGYSEGQLICFDPIKKETINRISLPDVAYGTSINILDDDIIIGTAVGYLVLYKAKGYGNVELNDTLFIGDYEQGIISILRVHKHKLLLGTFRSLFEYNIVTQKFTNIKADRDTDLNPSQTSISDIIKDNEGNIWFATDEDGVGKIGVYKNPFKHIDVWPENSLKRDKVYSLEVDSQNNLWIGTTQGLVQFDQIKQEYNYFEYDPKKTNGINNSIISSILYSTGNKLLIGTIGGGLNTYDKVTSRFSHYIYSEGDTTSLAWDYIKSLFESKDGTIWVGSFGSGLEKFDKDIEKFYHYKFDVDDSTTTNARRIIDFAEDKHGNLWLATMMYGVDYFDRKLNVFKHFTHDLNVNNSISSNNTTALYLQNDSLLWIGTNASGLNKYNIDDGKFSIYTTDDGLISNSISSIVPDSNGKLWLSTTNGISEFDPEKELFRNFNSEDGINNIEFTPAARSSDSEGNIYFGGDNGVTKFHPDSVKINSVSLKPIVTKLKVIDAEREDGNKLPFKEYYFVGDTIQLSTDEYYFSIEYSAPYYNLQNKLRFAYTLEGIQDDWIITDHSNRVATFTHLPYGEYTFKISTLDENGNISPNQLEKTVIITPMFYETAWFYLLLLIFVLGLAYYIYRLRINKVLEVEKLRLKIASDLHDEVGSTLTKVSMRAEMLEMQINGEKESNSLHRIAEQARSAVSTMQDLVWAIDSRNDLAKDLFIKMKDTATSILSEKNVVVDFSVKDINDQENIAPEIRQNIFLILKEAIHNIAKHSNADNVSISVIRENGNIKMKISDNGSNFIKKVDHPGQGLKNMKMRAEKIKGKLEYSNNSGYTVLLTVPEK